MGKLFEGFKILLTDFDHILEKGGKLFKGGYSSREDTNFRKYGRYIRDQRFAISRRKINNACPFGSTY